MELSGILAAELSGLTGSGLARARAAIRWLHDARPVPAVLPERVPGIAARAWHDMRAAAPLPRWRLAARQPAADGTVKLALALDGATIETVLIPEPRHATVCVSSQAGCSRRCAFCATARLGLARQLTAGEMVLQVLVAAAELPAGARPRNVVFMGMGEPMDNLDEVLRAVRVLCAEPAPRLAARHVTVSTSGVLPGMRRFLAESPAHLALSLNATTDAQREALMPHTQKWPIAALLGELAVDRARAPRRRHFIEYVLLHGVNDGDDDARRLPELLAGVNAHVNLIPWNGFPGAGFAAPPVAHVRAFQARLQAAGLRCLVRWPRGHEVAAACGQLAAAALGSA